MAGATEHVVYVVDDDQGMLDSTVWLLESVGLKALPFTSGGEFLNACDASLDACVLLDVRMPGMGGLNVQEEMRARELNLPIIFVSGHADVPIVVRAFKAGAHDFIEKPYNEQLLLDSVHQALSNCAQNRSGNQGHDALQARLLTLTPRERDVLRLLSQGRRTAEIASALHLSPKTVSNNLTTIFAKLEVADRTAAVIRARERGLGG